MNERITDWIGWLIWSAINAKTFSSAQQKGSQLVS